MTAPDGIGPLTPDQAIIAAASLDLAAGDLVAVHNGILTKVHSASLCAGEHCWVHNPSPHHMSTWPIWSARSRTALRICPHDFDHPDPDDVTYNARVSGTFQYTGAMTAASLTSAKETQEMGHTGSLASLCIGAPLWPS